jgi:hypothetical protein
MNRKYSNKRDIPTYFVVGVLSEILEDKSAVTVPKLFPGENDELKY